MSFFDASDRGALTLTLSRNDPLDATYSTDDGEPLYRVSTQKTKMGSGSRLGAAAEVTTIQRIRRRPAATRRRLKSSPLARGDDMICVATIERRPLSLTSVTLNFNGTAVPANKFLKKERPFSSARVFRALTGEVLKWKLSTPTPKLYDSNNNKIAKYCRPFLPSRRDFSSKTAVIEIAEGIESDKMLDEIIVSLLLTFFL